MSKYANAISRIRIGAVDSSSNPVPAKVVREQAKVAAGTSVNTHKRYFGYGRLVPQADIAPEDQVITKNSDDVAAMDAWLATASGDPQMIWTGYFDNTTGQLVKDTLGTAIVVTPDVTSSSKKSGGGMGWLIAGAIGVGGLMFATRKKG